ncbi:glycosyl transferase, group 1 [Methanococcus maripaludis C5]|uniref:Glycosyl transferase, group 1 n=1 Tax=Methanococcus maripaludis (strain C5 / ATCC BAA-1333) TaxID=402880 RepID=A4FZH2_METM5|nr:glycosyltransferase [Methanococcus maripaludis]ABO35606.1 glycosyl transferase, group 1 [Methanococcus maripaludis C5]
MKILDVAPWGIYPPKYGGPNRINNINLELAKLGHEILLFSQGLGNNEKNIKNFRSWTTKIDKNYSEFRYVNLLELGVRALMHYPLKTPPIFSGSFLKIFSPKILSKSIDNSDLIIVEKPWQFEHVFKKNNQDKPIIIDTIDVEYFRVQSILKNKPFSKNILDIVKDKEQFAVENSDAVLAVSEEDVKKFSEYYGISKSKLHVAPNGVNTKKIKPTDYDEKENLKSKYGFKNKTIVLFTGSEYYPNIEAVSHIINFSKSLKNENILILIVGSCGNQFSHKKYNNIIFTGIVDKIEDYLKIADIALNPILSGGGSNIKLFEYMAAGLPIVTTYFGARGSNLKNNVDAIISDIADFSKNIELIADNEDFALNIGKNARNLAVEKYSWDSVAKKIDNVINKLC